MLLKRLTLDNPEGIYIRQASVNMLSRAQMLSVPRARNFCSEHGAVPYATSYAEYAQVPRSLMRNELKCEYNARHGLLETRFGAVEYSASR
jgi:predicted aminopeptidase